MIYKYKSYMDLSVDMWEWNQRIPQNIDLIVGIPRSGMLAANILALYKNLPYTDLDSFINNTIIKGGERLNMSSLDHINKVLVLDDSIRSGNAITKAIGKLSKLNDNYQITLGAVYADPKSINIIDCYYELLPERRVFQWNVFNHSHSHSFCYDIDGVLCRDPNDEENDDGSNYINFITNVKPNFIPKYEVGFLVTSRLEKYRQYTEKWLEKNNIKYNKLYMLDLPSKEERIKKKIHSKFKAYIYNSVKSNLFIESSYRQAIEISQITGKQVFSVQNMQMISPGITNYCSGKFTRLFKKLL